MSQKQDISFLLFLCKALHKNLLNINLLTDCSSFPVNKGISSMLGMTNNTVALTLFMKYAFLSNTCTSPT